MRMRIEGGRALLEGGLEETSIHVDCESGEIAGLGAQASAERAIDASGLLILPGIVDVHGDAFERQMMPRPGVGFPIDVALLESDRQAVANGISTVFHGVTWSWEGGLRGAENARAILDGIERLRPRLGADTRYHLRHETYNLDAEPEILTWLAGRRIDAIAFNDHMSGTVDASSRAQQLAQMVARAGVTRERFLAVAERTKRRANEVPASIERLAAAANASGVPLLSHDDASPEQRRWFRALGCRSGGIPDHGRDRRGRRLPWRRYRARRPQRRSRWQPHRMDRRHRDDRAGTLLGAGLGLLLSGASARGLCARTARRPPIRASLGAGVADARQRRRAQRSRADRARPARGLDHRRCIGRRAAARRRHHRGRPPRASGASGHHRHRAVSAWPVPRTA